jgi:ABC-type dipeptide/oligopeptide/nickel transport system permease component
VTTFVVRRLIALVFLAFGMSIISFLIIHLIPGDPVVAMLSGNSGSTSMIHRLHHELGLDQPLPIQYVTWVGNLLHGNLGYSYASNVPVTTLLGQNAPYTAQLAVAGLIIALVLGVVLGVIAAIYHNTIIDTISMSIALVGLSVPSFWLGLLFISLFSVTLRWFAVFGGTTLSGLVLPAITIGIGGAGFTARFVRSRVLDAMHMQYVVTARAKGLTRYGVLTRHVLRNSILPLLTIIGLEAGNLLSGAVVVETVFSRPGIGRLLVNSILNKDYLTVQSLILLIALVYAITNLIVDLLYPVADPRIVYG